MSIKDIFPNAAQFDTMNDALISIAEGLGAYQIPKTWAAIQRRVRGGVIGRILQPGDQTQVDLSTTVTATPESETITTVSVTADTFVSQMGSATGDYVFTYDTSWHYDGQAVSLTTYGLAITGTASEGDSILVRVTATGYDANVMGIDEEIPVNPALEHCLSIQMEKVYSSINFDVPQFLFAVTAEACTAFGWPSTGMPAGTYNVTLSHGAYNGGTAEDGTFQFTTTQIVPVGGGIRHSYMGTYQSSAAAYGKDKVLAGTWTTYAADTFTTLESGLATTEGSDGTSLGTATAANPTYKSGDFINFTQRQRYGSNRWSTSYLRQLLNSDEVVLTWKPGTIWSRNLNITPSGFLYLLNADLKAVLAPVRKRYALCISDGYGYEDIEDVVTVATMLDVFGSKNNSISEGPVTEDGTLVRETAYSYWAENNTNADRIKKNGSSAAYWWLSSVNPSGGVGVRFVDSSGALNISFAYSSLGSVPCLHIA